MNLRSLLTAAVCALMLPVTVANAITMDERDTRLAQIRASAKALRPTQENVELLTRLAKQVNEEYQSQRDAAGTAAAANVFKDNPTAPFPCFVNCAFYDLGAPTLETLTYGWIETNAGSDGLFDAVETPSDIFLVTYEFNLTDGGPWTPIGSSSDRTDSFALSWEITGFNPIVRATPFDRIGNILIFTDPDDPTGNYGQAQSVNIAFVPLPAGGLLSGSALIGLIALGRKRREKRHGSPRKHT